MASLLLERRVLLVARDADTVSAAVHAAAALLYPFRWQHIFLPLLPLALKVRPSEAAGGWLAGWVFQQFQQESSAEIRSSPPHPHPHPHPTLSSP